MTIINPNSISGISSITALNSTAAINLFKADGTAANIIAGVTTGSNFKTGSSNLHSTGLTVGNALVHSTGVNVGTGATVHSPSTNVLTLGTNSAERLRIQSNGDVIWNGIGTQLAGEGNNTVGMGFEPRNGTIFLSRGDNATILSNRNNDGRHIHFNQGGSGKFAIGLQNSGADLAFFSGAGNSPTERVRFANDGHVAIGGYGDPASILDIREENDGGQTKIMLWNTDNDNTTTQTSGLFMSPDSRAYAYAGISVKKENADMSNNAGRDVSLVLNTTQNNSQVEAVRIYSSGKISTGVDNDSYEFTIGGLSGGPTLWLRDSGTSGTPRILFGDTSAATKGAIYYSSNDNDMTFYTNGTEKLGIDSNGRVLFSRGGLTASRNVGTKTGEIQVANSGNSSAITIIGYSNDVTGPHLMFGKTRSTNATGNTIVQDGDRLGEIAFCGNDGSDLDSFGAAIKCHVDGTPGANDMPGKLQFYTTPDGGSSSIERLCITSGGQVQIKENAGSSSVGASLKFYYANNNSTDVISSIIFANNVGEVATIQGETRNGNTNGMIRFNNQVNGVNGESMRLNHDGGFCVGTDSTRTAEFTTPDGFSVRSRDSSKGQFQVSVSGTTCGLLNRKSSNGDILSFRKDGTGVGHIGVNASTMYLNFGGTTAAAHQLDDYEEGDHNTTVTMSGDTNFTYNNRTLAYTKIGRLVHVTGRLHLSGCGGSSFSFTLPFTCASGVKFETSNEFQNIRFNDGYTFRISDGTAAARIQSDGSNTGIGVDNPHLNVNLTYFTS